MLSKLEGRILQPQLRYGFRTIINYTEMVDHTSNSLQNHPANVEDDNIFYPYFHVKSSDELHSLVPLVQPFTAKDSNHPHFLRIVTFLYRLPCGYFPKFLKLDLIKSQVIYFLLFCRLTPISH